MSVTPLDLDHAMRVVSDAFLPYGCVTSANPDGESFGFSVLDAEGTPLLQVAQVTPEQYAEAPRLGELINQSRHELRSRGHVLQPWQMPFLPDPQGIPLTPPNY